MEHWETVKVQKSELAHSWVERLQPVERASRGLKEVRLYDVEVRLSEENGRVFLVLSGTEDFAIQTEIRVDLEDLQSKGGRNASAKLLQTAGELLSTRQR
jgi:hypothetical protein